VVAGARTRIHWGPRAFKLTFFAGALDL
jgi:hypothetical protein